MIPSCTDPATWPSSWLAFEARVLQLLNERRAAGANHGGDAMPEVASLTAEPRLNVAARCHSLDMATTGRLDHASSTGIGAWERIEAAGYGVPLCQGENIAAGYATPEAVVNGWMSSPGHRANILSARFRNAGVGYVFSASSPAGHYWTLDLAAR